MLRRSRRRRTMTAGAPMPMHRTHGENAPDAAARCTPSNPSPAIRPRNRGRRHGRMPHDPATATGPGIRRRRMARCRHTARSLAETGLRWRSRTSSVGINTRICTAQRPAKPSTPPLSASGAQTLTQDPQSSEIRPRFPPRQTCRRWMASIQQPQTPDNAAIETLTACGTASTCRKADNRRVGAEPSLKAPPERPGCTERGQQGTPHRMSCGASRD